jgi:hypothetical protein
MSDEDCKQCLGGIGRIEGHLESLNNSMMKIFYALIALASASIGTKFIGTPWHVEIAMWATMTGGVFVGLITFAKRKCLSFWEIWIRVSFVIYCVWCSSLRIYHYEAETPLTQAEGVITQMLVASLSIGFITLAWKRDAKRGIYKRRYNDIDETDRDGKAIGHRD